MAQYIKRKELAKLFRTSPRTISQWIGEGCPVIYTGTKKSPGSGSRPLFVPEEVEQWLKNRTRSKSAISASFFGHALGKGGLPI